MKDAVRVHNPRAMEDLFTYAPKEIIERIRFHPDTIRTYPYILVAIDIQDSYNWCRDDDHKNFLKEIFRVLKDAINDGAYVIVTELDPEDQELGGKTISQIIRILKDYKDKSFLTSMTNDKTQDILREMSDKFISGRYLKIVGVNADECILKTAQSWVKSKDHLPLQIGPVHTFNFDNEEEKYNNFCWAIEELQELELTITKEPLKTYHSYLELMEEHSESE